MKTESPIILWFRKDLRLMDNPALRSALERGAIVPVFVWSPDEEGDWPPGGASRFWLHQSLQALDGKLRELGSRLIIRHGNSQEVLESLVKETGANAIFWNRRYEPAIIERDKSIKEHFRKSGIDAQSFNSHLLFEPWTIANKAGKPFQVFTPFWKTCLASASSIPEPLTTPKKIFAPQRWPKSLRLEELELEPKVKWAEGIRAAWESGEVGAQKQLKRLLQNVISKYEESRNRPDQRGTSRLSPHLHFGEISVRQIWHGVRKHKSASAQKFLAELGWREFAHHLLFHFPQTPTEPLRADFKKFRWNDDAQALRAWQRGQTGYPIVDAGMRELWTTGWMHNRVRMIVGSFLVKDLLLPWQSGARWFWDTLVDADLANNTLGWQWVAGCGADAAPFFRIFNPVTQGEKFDPKGEYVRRWILEIAKLPDKWIHKPWQAPAEILSEAKLKLGKNYPEPIVSHAIAREVTLERYSKLKKVI